MRKTEPESQTESENERVKSENDEDKCDSPSVALSRRFRRERSGGTAVGLIGIKRQETVRKEYEMNFTGKMRLTNQCTRPRLPEKMFRRDYNGELIEEKKDESKTERAS